MEIVNRDNRVKIMNRDSQMKIVNMDSQVDSVNTDSQVDSVNRDSQVDIVNGEGQVKCRAKGAHVNPLIQCSRYSVSHLSNVLGAQPVWPELESPQRLYISEIAVRALTSAPSRPLPLLFVLSL